MLNRDVLHRHTTFFRRFFRLSPPLHSLFLINTSFCISGGKNGLKDEVELFLFCMYIASFSIFLRKKATHDLII